MWWTTHGLLILAASLSLTFPRSTALVPPSALPSSLSHPQWIRTHGSSHRSPSLHRLPGLSMTLAGGSKRMVAISSGRGSDGVPLASHVAEALMDQGMEVTPLEPMLRRAVLAPAECSLDDFYGQQEVKQRGDEGFLGVHESSGMQVTMGCPMHLIYGVKGGCEACKCRVPTMDEVKRFCPYYGSSAQGARDGRSAWALKKPVEEVLQQASHLVIISASEDISAPAGTPHSVDLEQYQTRLVDQAKEAGVQEVVLVGPSDVVSQSVRNRMNALMRDRVVGGKLGSAKSQFEGMEMVQHSDDMRVSGDAPAPLLLQRVLKEYGVPHRIIRGPHEVLTEKGFAEVVAQSVMNPGGQHVNMFARPIPGFKGGEGI